MSQRTVLYSEHQATGEKLVPFSGWEMPLYYQSQLHEHRVVRQAAGLFDVSHMLAVDLLGKDTLAFLSRILANNPQKLIPGKALYSCLLNEQGGIIDDLIVYQTGCTALSGRGERRQSSNRRPLVLSPCASV